MRSDGEYLATKYGCKYFELSALNDSEGVSRMFNIIAKLINDQLTSNLTSTSAILLNTSAPDYFEGRRRSRSLHDTQKEKKQNQKSPILFRKLLKTWHSSSLHRSKSSERLDY